MSVHSDGLNADVVIVAYQSGEVLWDCVNALRGDSAVRRIIIVDNSPWDPVAVPIGFDVEVLTMPDNIGFGSAVNAARHRIDAPYVIVANPDTTALKGTVAALVRFLDENPAVGLAAPRMVRKDGSVYQNSQRFLTLPRMVAERISIIPYGLRRSVRDHDQQHEAEYVLAAFICCRRTALESIGWFDPTIFLFGEDQDICRRLLALGWKVSYAAVGHVTHESGHSWRQLSDRAEAALESARCRELKANSRYVGASLYRWLLLWRRTLARARRR